MTRAILRVVDRVKEFGARVLVVGKNAGWQPALRYFID
jgi:hypothetical protein